MHLDWLAGRRSAAVDSSRRSIERHGRTKTRRLGRVDLQAALRSQLSLLLVAAAVLLSIGAQATPLDDYRRGTGVHLSSAAVRVEGNEYYTRDYGGIKAADSLDLAIDLHEFGLSADATVVLHGRTAGGQLIWTFDHSFSPPLDLGSGNFILRVAGELIANARPSAGTASLSCAGSLCDYSIVLQKAAGSHVDVWGHSQDTLFGWISQDWFRSVTELEFLAYAGLPRPPLADLAIEAPAPGRFCTSDRERAYAARVRLSSVAPVGGVLVNVGSDHATALRTRRVCVAAGDDSAAFTLFFPGAFAGDVHVGAASGGVSMSRSLRLDPCLPTIDDRVVVDDWFNERYGTCEACMEALRLNDRGTALVRSKGDWLVDEPALGGPKSLDDVVGVGKVGDAYVNSFGHLAGWVHLASGESAGFRVRGWPDDPKPELFPDFEPRTITDLGVLFGVCKGKTADGPCFYDGAWPSLLPVQGALGAPLVTLLGEAYGELATPVGVRAYRLAGDKVEELAGLGGETRVAAVNQAGDAVGWSRMPNKVHQAAIFRAGSGKAEPLGTLAGFADTEATGISDRGWVVGTATDTKGAKRAFLAVPGKGMVALDARVTLPKGGKLELYEALSISRDGAIVAKGVRDGARGTFVLRPAQ